MFYYRIVFIGLFTWLHGYSNHGNYLTTCYHGYSNHGNYLTTCYHGYSNHGLVTTCYYITVRVVTMVTIPVTRKGNMQLLLK